MRIAVVTEYSGAADDGNRRFADDLVAGLRADGHAATISELDGDARVAALRPRSWLAVRRLRPDVVQYVPGSGLTRNALVRLRFLRLLCPTAVAAVAALFGREGLGDQPRPVRADLVLFASPRLERATGSVARRSVVVPPAVDVDRFRPAGRPPAEIRAELGLDPARPLVLHVGHLRGARNLPALARLAREGEWQVLLLASPRYAGEPGIEQELGEAGVAVMRRWVPDLERYYQAADVYVFPVDDPGGAIEVPLTVLEALACSTPVVTTPFGGLPELFPASDGLVYAAPGDFAEAVRGAASGARGACRALVEELTPRAQARVVAGAYEDARAGR